MGSADVCFFPPLHYLSQNFCTCLPFLSACSFGCCPCAILFSLICLLLLFIPWRWLLLSLPSSAQPIVTLVPVFPSLSVFVFFLKRCFTFPFLLLTWLVLHVSNFECPTVIHFSPLVYLLTERDGGRAVGTDWWMAGGRGWEDLGVWLTLLSLRIILTELAASKQWKGSSVNSFATL